MKKKANKKVVAKTATPPAKGKQFNPGGFARAKNKHFGLK